MEYNRAIAHRCLQRRRLWRKAESRRRCRLHMKANRGHCTCEFIPAHLTSLTA